MTPSRPQSTSSPHFNHIPNPVTTLTLFIALISLLSSPAFASRTPDTTATTTIPDLTVSTQYSYLSPFIKTIIEPIEIGDNGSKSAEVLILPTLSSNSPTRLYNLDVFFCGLEADYLSNWSNISLSTTLTFRSDAIFSSFPAIYPGVPQWLSMQKDGISWDELPGLVKNNCNNPISPADTEFPAFSGVFRAKSVSLSSSQVLTEQIKFPHYKINLSMPINQIKLPLRSKYFHIFPYLSDVHFPIVRGPYLVSKFSSEIYHRIPQRFYYQTPIEELSVILQKFPFLEQTSPSLPPPQDELRGKLGQKITKVDTLHNDSTNPAQLSSSQQPSPLKSQSSPLNPPSLQQQHQHQQQQQTHSQEFSVPRFLSVNTHSSTIPFYLEESLLLTSLSAHVILAFDDQVPRTCKLSIEVHSPSDSTEFETLTYECLMNEFSPHQIQFSILNDNSFTSENPKIIPPFNMHLSCDDSISIIGYSPSSPKISLFLHQQPLPRYQNDPQPPSELLSSHLTFFPALVDRHPPKDDAFSINELSISPFKLLIPLGIVSLLAYLTISCYYTTDAESVSGGLDGGDVGEYYYQQVQEDEQDGIEPNGTVRNRRGT